MRAHRPCPVVRSRCGRARCPHRAAAPSARCAAWHRAPRWGGRVIGRRALRGYRGRTETPPAKLSACATCHARGNIRTPCRAKKNTKAVSHRGLLPQPLWLFCGFQSEPQETQKKFVILYNPLKSSLCPFVLKISRAAPPPPSMAHYPRKIRTATGRCGAMGTSRPTAITDAIFARALRPCPVTRSRCRAHRPCGMASRALLPRALARAHPCAVAVRTPRAAWR